MKNSPMSAVKEALNFSYGPFFQLKYMKVTSVFLNRLHLDPKHGQLFPPLLVQLLDTTIHHAIVTSFTYAIGLLNARACQLCYEYFCLLDHRGTGGLDDIQFATFLQCVTDLNRHQIENIFDIFDLDRSGSCEFDEVRIVL
jgi:hypothetical protein